jgi:hypothetical protein
VPASWSESGDWSTGDVGEPETDDGEVGVEAEPAQPVASNAAMTKLTSERELFIIAGTLCKFVCRLDGVR